ncbi:MAG: metallophosphoesterase [Burkholderiales bacterium]|nr:metallophosphoesterase [Burkholderiales bacterium]MDE1929573.1 metallophosphoesterase [Burkholderiales bacterium]MDE2159391.1 metallophosphoesterase [Burkholderiales bacterium]MDE2502864.1 metallophosphoesterase [Burkholderiales bacterium]
MKLQLLSDLHLETENFDPRPVPGAELLVLAGDIDSRWQGYERFAGWPVPVLAIGGNHEYDGRDVDAAAAGLRAHCAALGLRYLECETALLTDAGGRRIRVLGTTRWSDFDLYGAAGRERAERAAAYFMRLMGSTRGGQPFDAAAVRAQALRCRAWLERELRQPAQGRWDATLVVTHFGPSIRSVDPRYGRQPGSASFCNDDEDLIPYADLWLHGHLHCRHDYLWPRAGRAPTRVVCQALGLEKKGEQRGYDPGLVFEV